MLKTTVLPERSTLERLGVGDGEVNGFSVGGGVEHAKKLEKISKSRNLAKSGKKLSKSRNLTNFDAIEAGPKFSTLDTRIAFHRLRLTFIKAPIL